MTPATMTAASTVLTATAPASLTASATASAPASVTPSVTTLLTWALLAVAGAAGAVCRFEVDAAVGRLRTRWHASHAPRPGGPAGREHRLAGVPLGTLVVNASACLLLGLLTGLLTEPAASAGTRPATALLVLGTGFCGGYSTFSTACVEAGRLVLAGRVGAGVSLAVVMAMACQGLAAVGLLAGAAL